MDTMLLFVMTAGTNPTRMNQAMKMKPLAAGNWKMNGLKTSVEQVEALKAMLAGTNAKCDVMVVRRPR
jgi:hypothetical protein